MAQARGVAIFLCRKAGLAIEEYTPLQVKIALTGYGRAEKMQVAAMAKKLLAIPADLTQDDTLDALALCITSAAFRLP